MRSHSVAELNQVIVDLVVENSQVQSTNEYLSVENARLRAELAKAKEAQVAKD